MDDITNKRFDRVEKQIAEVKADVGGLKADMVDLKADMVGLKADLGGRIDSVARGLDASINGALAAGFRAAGEDRRRLHAETMHRFQLVIDEELRGVALRDLRGRLVRCTSLQCHIHIADAGNPVGAMPAPHAIDHRCGRRLRRRLRPLCGPCHEQKSNPRRLRDRRTQTRL